MDDRVAKACRIRAIQEKLHRIEEWKLAGLQQQLVDLEALRTDTIAALNDADALQDLFLDARARRLRRLAEEIARVGAEQEQQAQRVLEQGRRAKMAANLAARAEERDRMAAERENLHGLIEDWSAREMQASRKIAEG